MIPSGTRTVLPEGSEVKVTQSLGGTLTVRTPDGQLYRVATENIPCLGETAVELFPVEKHGESDHSEVTSGVPATEEQVWNALKACYDPEIPVNIVDLGLIYDCRLDADGDHAVKVSIKMTLTARGCGMGPVIADDARQKVETLPGVSSAEVEIVWDPVWTPHMISDEGRKMMGLS